MFLLEWGKVLSCIDCGKDFYGDDYVHHTKCISEAEKYQGALYQDGGGSSKGEKKQHDWLEVKAVLFLTQHAQTCVWLLLDVWFLL